MQPPHLLTQTAHTVSQEVDAQEEGTSLSKLPLDLQAHIHLLHKLVASLVILSAAPLPHATPATVPRLTTLSPSSETVRSQAGSPFATPAYHYNCEPPKRCAPSMPPTPSPTLHVPVSPTACAHSSTSLSPFHQFTSTAAQPSSHPQSTRPFSASRAGTHL